MPIVFLQCKYKAVWMVRHNDALYGAISIGAGVHEHPINTFCKNHLNKKDYAILETLIEANPFKSTRELLIIQLDLKGTTLMANPLMANLDKVTVVRKTILKSMYMDFLNAISLYQKSTSHFLTIIPESTADVYADISYQSKEMRSMYNRGRFQGFSADVTFKVAVNYNVIISLVHVPQLKRSVPILFSFIRGNKEGEFFNHFNLIANMILEYSSCSYDMFRTQFRESMDWSRAQYNGFVHSYKQVALKHFADEYDPLHLRAQVRGCKYHFFNKNAKSNFIDAYKRTLEEKILNNN